MNRSILIVICDFLVSAMLSMMTGMVPGHAGGTGIGLDAPTTALLLTEIRRQQLQLEQARRELLEAQREHGFTQERADRLAALAGELAAAQLKREQLEERQRMTPENSGKLTPAQLQERLEAALKRGYADRIQLADARAELQRTGGELLQANTAAAVTARQLQERDARLQNADRELGKIRAELTAREAALAAREAELAAERGELRKTRDALSGAQRELSQAAARTGQAEHQAHQLEATLSFTRGQLSSAERELAEARSLAERERRLAAAREVERNEAERQLENVKKMLKNAVTELSQTRRELTVSRAETTASNRELAQAQSQAQSAEAKLEAARLQLGEAEKKLRSDVLDRYSESALRLDFLYSEKRLIVDHELAVGLFLPVVKIAGKTVVPGAFADLTGAAQSPLSYRKINRVEYRITPPGAENAPAPQPLNTPMLIAPGEPRLAAFETDPAGRTPLTPVSVDVLRQRGLQNLFLFKTSSFGKESADLGGRCSIDFSSADPYLYVRNTGRGTGSELRAEPGDFLMTREGDFVGVIVSVESFDLGRRQEAKCFVFPENFSWEGAETVPVADSAAYGSAVRRNAERIQQLEKK